MAKGLTFDNALLQLLFQNNAGAAPISAIGSGLGSATTAGDLYIAFHTADPTASGNQSTNEISYTGYARQGVVRSSGGWTVTANSVYPAANIVFGAMTGGAGGTVTHWSVGTAASGTGYILYAGPVTPNIIVAVGVTPVLTPLTAITES